MKNKLCVFISIPFVWILNLLPHRRLLDHEIAMKLELEHLMADEDILRIVRDKPQLVNWESGPVDSFGQQI